MLALAPAVLAPFEHPVHSLVHELPPPKPVAVVHVGPPKTGSTTLQYQILRDADPGTNRRSFGRALEADGYELLPPNLPGPHAGPKAGANVAFHLQRAAAPASYVGPNVSEATWPAFRAWAADAAARNRSVVFSSEELRPGIAVDLLADALAPFDVRIVVAYRRFDAWLRSVHAEVDIGADPHLPPYSSWLTAEMARSFAQPRGRDVVGER